MSFKQTQWTKETAPLVNALNQETIKRMEERIKELEDFVRDVRDNWDCDTGANGAHHHCCRACEAKRLLPKEETK
jgi:cob(I)alamin adenosyltransferase